MTRTFTVQYTLVTPQVTIHICHMGTNVNVRLKNANGGLL